MNKKLAILIPASALVLLLILRPIFDINPRVFSIIFFFIILSIPVLNGFSKKNKNN